jgi:nucleotide-binding universal stress UspA family protein
MVPVLEDISAVETPAPARTVKGAPTIILATDGTAQSDQAVAIVGLIGDRIKSSIKVLTVVDQLPIPWGPFDSRLAAGYEEGLKAEALRTAERQVEKLGDSQWSIEVKAGDAAETIAATATDTRARLVIVGLGGHGGASRVFGSETALRLARVSKTPVLAVEPHLGHLPRRILVAMDFSEASIEAARLSVELADQSGSIVLVHVVPWKPTPFVPDEWIKTHEASISAQLSRVVGWLNRHSPFHIGQQILYGRPGHTLLKYAEELGADLIATGTHGRTAPKRLLGGQTVDKLIRGAHCSVLVFPAAAAFRDTIWSETSEQ